MLEADGEAVEEWLMSPKFEAHLFLIFPCTDITPSLANKARAPAPSALASTLDVCPWQGRGPKCCRPCRGTGLCAGQLGGTWPVMLLLGRPCPLDPERPQNEGLATMHVLQALQADSPARQQAAQQLDDYDFSKEATLEERCTEAFAAVQHFEKTHCLALQVRPLVRCGPQNACKWVLSESCGQRIDTAPWGSGLHQASCRVHASGCGVRAAPVQARCTDAVPTVLHRTSRAERRAESSVHGMAIRKLLPSRCSCQACSTPPHTHTLCCAQHSSPQRPLRPRRQAWLQLRKLPAAQNMSFAYLQRRPELVATALAYAQQLMMKDEVAHDAVLLMDRTMSTSLQVRRAASGAGSRHATPGRGLCERPLGAQRSWRSPPVLAAAWALLQACPATSALG